MQLSELFRTTLQLLIRGLAGLLMLVGLLVAFWVLVTVGGFLLATFVATLVAVVSLLGIAAAVIVVVMVVQMLFGEEQGRRR